MRLGRAILAFLLLPGTIAFLVPLGMASATGSWQGFLRWGLPPLGAGIGVLIWCAGIFHVAGRGTLAPWMPPERLVQAGPYRLSRNPMYVAVLLILAGWAIGFGSSLLAGYAGAMAAVFHLRVVLHEEPALARRFGAAWTRYRDQVPRWVGRPRGTAG